ncbi:MAG: hypothetical protein RLP09_38255 [Sandaracinaceae bacterium]
MTCRGFPSALAALLALGCSSIISPDDGRLGGDPGVDASVRDSGTGSGDADVDPDSGVERDSGPPVECGDTPRCEGDNLVSCVAGMEARQDCRARDAYCEAGACVDWVCEPGSRECNDDLSATIICDARGRTAAESRCTGGSCDPDTGNCGDRPSMCDGLPEIEVGDTIGVDLCGESDDETFVPMGPNCASDSRADVGDRVYRLEVTSPQNLVIQLSDDDSRAAIDTVLYVRTTCDVAGSQIACDDDEPCSTIPFPGSCTDGVALGISRIRDRFEPGVYYIVIDAFEYTSGERRFRCGDVELTVRRAG